MKKTEINLFDYAPQILKALKRGVLLTTKADNKVNSMIIAWGNLGIDWSRPIFTTFVRTGRYTHELLEKNPEFTINIPIDKVDPKIVATCGTKSGRDIDKVSEAGLTLVEPSAVSVPAIKELPITLECRVVYKQDQDLSVLPQELRDRFYPADVPSSNPDSNKDCHTAYEGEIVAAYVIED